MIAIITTVHPRHDTRIFVKEFASLAMVYPNAVALYVQDGQGDAFNLPSNASIIDTGKVEGGRLKRMFLGSWTMFRTVLADKPKLVHLQDPELVIIGFLFKLFGIKVLYDVHEDLPRQILSKSYLHSIVRKPLSFVATFFEWLAGKAFDGIIVATPTIGARFPQQKTTIVQNFPKASEFEAVDLPNAEESKPSIGYIGGITSTRGIIEMLDALPHIKNVDMRFILVGSFQEKATQILARNNSNWSKVEFRGWQHRHGVAKALSEMKAGLVVLHPTLAYIDSLPVKMFEYMAAGIPVIASDFPLWRQIIEESNCGLLVDPMDPTAIAAAMDWVLDNPIEAAEMGKRGQRAVVEKYNWGKESDKLMALYSDILHTPSEEVVV